MWPETVASPHDPISTETLNELQKIICRGKNTEVCILQYN